MSAVKMHMESEVTSTEWPKSKKELKSPVFIACVLPSRWSCSFSGCWCMSPRTAPRDTTSKIKTIRSYFSFIHNYGNKHYHTDTVRAGLQCWFQVLLTELWRYFLISILAMYYCPLCLGSRKEKGLCEGTLLEAGKGQRILKNELEM